MGLWTNYKEKIPHDMHPLPQFMRDEWQNLNGEWEFCVCALSNSEPSQAPLLLDGVEFSPILVPFSPECEKSGVGNFVLKPDQRLIYRKKFVVSQTLLAEGCDRKVLHFGAVDSFARVWLNGVYLGAHECGFTSFEFDISHCLIRDGVNELVVEVTDNFIHGARGKQSVNRGGIWYTAQSGIWQTVWIEAMVKNPITNYRITTDAIGKTVKISANSNGRKQVASIVDNDEIIMEKEFDSTVEFAYDFECWSPENPKLYGLILTNEDGDHVKSYFGVRTFSESVDKSGKKRLFLNGKPYFFSGVLDQGYWPESLLTPPSNKALHDDLKMLKDMGFNTVRKHIKIEPMRWYYYCDVLGLVVWQDFVSGGSEYDWRHIALYPFLGIKHDDSDYKYFARENEKGRAEFVQMAHDIVHSLYNCTCIGMWVVFNEGWGQFDSAQMTQKVAEWDDTRVIDSVSGWHDQGADKTTLLSLHTYYTPLVVPKDERTVVLSEFGGYSMKVDGHVFDEKKEFGYKKFKTQPKLEKALEKLFVKKLAPLIKKGLSASIYTQLSDVEEEINGLITYDRKVVKVTPQFMKKLNEYLYTQVEDL